jgi:alkylation response protein AidB-like acyl-CoA dehydrogenase
VSDDLRPLTAALDAPAIAAALEEDEQAGVYPARAVAALRAAGLADLLTEGPRFTIPHVHALNSLAARRGTSLGITTGVNALALLPVWAGAGPELLARVQRRVREGAFASLLLTELPHGSNLLRNAVTATPVEGGWRLDGTKDLINGGTEHELLVTLARTRTAAPKGAALLQPLTDFSVFVVERDGGPPGTVVALPRWRTLPAQAADIGGVRFDGRLLTAADLVGTEGSGFRLVRKALTVSRGGIASLASGTATRAVDLALAWARGRDVWGGPILALGAVAEHVMRALALEQVVAAAAVHAAAASNAHGPAAAVATAVAKVAGCALAEECVRQASHVLGGRALLEELPFARLLRDVLLYGVFDGTRHVVGDDLARLETGPLDPTAPCLDALRELYATPPRPAIEALRGLKPGWQLPLAGRLAALAALPGEVPLDGLARAASALADAIEALREADGSGSGGRWTRDGGVRLQVAEVAAELEALAAAAELVDPDRRAALGLRPLPAAAGGPALDRLVWRFAVGWLGARAVDRVRNLAVRSGRPAHALDGCSAALLAGHDEVRAALHAALLAG